MKINYVILILFLISILIISRIGDLAATLSLGFSAVIMFLAMILTELKE